IGPATAEVHARLGLIYFQERKFAEAIAALREAIRLKPGLPKLDTLLAMSLSELGRYEGAACAPEGIRAIGGSGAETHGRTAPAACVHGAGPRPGGGRSGAAPLA